MGMKMIGLMMSLVMGIASASCNAGSNAPLQSSSPEPKEIQHKTQQEASSMTSDKSRPYFQLNDQQLHSLIENAQKVQLGDSRQRVENLLGKPSSDDLVMPKKTNKPIGRFVTYYVLKQDKDLVNERLDKLVMFRFDTNDRLMKIISQVPGIQSRP
jgi:hypothetical protein